MLKKRKIYDHFSEIMTQSVLAFSSFFRWPLSEENIQLEYVRVEYVHMRGKMNSDPYKILFPLKISLRCAVSSLHAFT